MTSNPVGWFEVYVQDMTRARTFYEAVFQVGLEKLNTTVPEIWVFPQSLAAHGSGGALVRAEGVPSGGNSTVVYFECADCAVEASRIVPAGGRILKDKFSVGQFGFVALGFDTEGNMFGLHSLQ